MQVYTIEENLLAYGILKMTSNSILSYPLIEIPHEPRLALVICLTNRMQENHCAGISSSIDNKMPCHPYLGPFENLL